jgi:hypothetical protein
VTPNLGLPQSEIPHENPRARYLLITEGDVADEGHAAAQLTAAAPDRVQTWTVEDRGHTRGVQTRPGEWEARVIAFLTDSLAPS